MKIVTPYYYWTIDIVLAVNMFIEKYISLTLYLKFIFFWQF